MATRRVGLNSYGSWFDDRDFLGNDKFPLWRCGCGCADNEARRLACRRCERKCPVAVLRSAWQSAPVKGRPPMPSYLDITRNGNGNTLNQRYENHENAERKKQKPSRDGRKLGDFLDAAEDLRPATREKKPPASRDSLEGIKETCKQMREQGLSEEIVRAAELELTAKLPPKPQRSASAEYNSLLSKLQCINKSIESKQQLRDDKAKRIEALQLEIIEDDAELGGLQVDRAKLEAERAASQHAAAPSADADSLPPFLVGAPPDFLLVPEVVTLIQHWRQVPAALAMFTASADAAAAAKAAQEPAATPPGNVPESATAAAANSGSGGSGGSNADEKPDEKPDDDPNDDSNDAEMGNAVPTTVEEAATFAEGLDGPVEPEARSLWLKRIAERLDVKKAQDVAVKRAKLAPPAERP